MFSITPFTSDAKVPARMRDKAAIAAINKEVATGASYTTLSIKGKVFTLVRDNERRVMTKADDPDEVLQSVVLTVVRANKNSRTYFAKAYNEEDKGGRPDCFSHDGQTPDADATAPQSKSCATCKRNVWGDTPNGVGTSCSSSTRLAVVDPERIGDPMLLRVPPASRSAFADVGKLATARGLAYNALALKVSFDSTAATPKLLFKVLGCVDEASYDTVMSKYDTELVHEIIGRPSEARAHVPALPAPDEAAIDEVLGQPAPARAVKPAPFKVVKPAPVPVVDQDDEDGPDAAPAPVAKAKPAVAAVAKPVAKPAPVAASDDDNLLDELDALLSATDD